MTDITSQTLVIGVGASQSNSVFVESGYALAGIQSPQMEATTALLYFEVSRDGPGVADGSATFVPLYKQDGSTRVSVGSLAAAACRSQVDVPAGLLGITRFRVTAVTAGGVAVVQTAIKTLYPCFARVV